ncbi:hypothetical protein [Methylobacterium sp. A54F]
MPDPTPDRTGGGAPAAPAVADAAFLGLAVERGLLDPAQAAALLDLRREMAGQDPSVPDLADDEERVRFVTGFADIFVSIGILLVLGTTGYLLVGRVEPALGWGAVAALAWGLAELFSRRRRMALPSIVLLVAFVGAGYAGVVALLGGEAGLRAHVLGPRGSPGGALPYLGATLAACGLAALHFRRFRVPITVAAGAGAAAAAAYVLAGALLPAPERGALNAVMALLGLAIFALAMRYDLSDPARATRRTDIAFWLHLLAAPLIVHPVLGLVTLRAAAVSPAAALAVLALILCLALVALATDRRAILVSGLTYAGIALGTLIREVGFGTQAGPYSLLGLGLFVLLISLTWRDLRGRVLRALPDSLAARLPQPTGFR